MGSPQRFAIHTDDEGPDETEQPPEPNSKRPRYERVRGIQAEEHIVVHSGSIMWCAKCGSYSESSVKGLLDRCGEAGNLKGAPSRAPVLAPFVGQGSSDFRLWAPS